MHRQWIGWVGLLTLFLALGLGAGPALAHGEAVLTVTPAVAAPGNIITVKGEGVEAGETFDITLEGLTFQVPLGTVTVGDDEDFHEEFTIPADAAAGTYQVRATSAEGETLAAELTIEASTTKAERAVPAEPSDEPMQLDRRRPGGELAAIVFGLLVSTGLGLVLLRASK